jgi:hypothetical protein
LRCVCFCGGGVRPPTQNGWATSPSEGRHTLLPKVKGRREGVEDAVGEGTSDGIPKREIVLANSGGGMIGIERDEGGRVRPCQEDWACKDGGINQCNDKAGCGNVPSGGGRQPY